LLETGVRSVANFAWSWFALGMAQKYPTIIPGMRGPAEKVGGLVYFGRMLDKVRLAAQGKLPAPWSDLRGLANPQTFDARCCRFLGIEYAALEARVLKGGTDEDILEWAFKTGRKPTQDEVEMWNAFLVKRGWRDDATERLHFRLAEIGLPPGTVETMFEFMDLDEGRRK
jgi:hypothetical protein